MRNDLKMFAQDTMRYGTYLYASGATKSIDVSSKRRSKSILEMVDFSHKCILDIGCGDGIYTHELSLAQPTLIVGIDPIKEVIERAKEKYCGWPRLRFECADLYTMDLPKNKYDIVVLRGVLHHLPDLDLGIERACLFGKRVLILEPNGYNPILKIIEKTSRYHIEHQEQSFTPHLLRKKFIKNGTKIIKDEYIGLIATFCPDWMVGILKFFEPLAEKLPFIKNIICGQYTYFG